MKHAFTSLVVAALAIFSLLTPVQAAEWADVVAAAKREGKVVVLGPQGNETRDALVEGFQSKYPEIKVEYSGRTSASLPPKLLAEQKAKRYSVDLLVQGTGSVIGGLLPVKAVTPIKPFMVGPNTA